jgi:hypothetical protein
MANLYDACLGFQTFFCWLAWRERVFGVKIFGFVFIGAAGNIAVSVPVLIQLFELKSEESTSALFWPKTA